MSAADDQRAAQQPSAAGSGAGAVAPVDRRSSSADARSPPRRAAMPTMPRGCRARGLLRREAAQAEDEEHARGEIGERTDDVGRDHRSASLPEHAQHALGDEEAAGDVDRREQDGDARRGSMAPAPRRRRARSMPPMTMMPLMALVTLISGVCSAGVTFQMTCQPTTHASRNTVRCWRNSGGPNSAGSAQQRPPPAPRPRSAPPPSSAPAAAAAPCRAGLAAGLGAGAAAGGAAASGGGHISSPSFSTSAPRWTSSSRSMAKPCSPARTASLSRLQHGRRVQLARLARHAARQIGEADDGDAVLLDDLVALGERAVAALLGRHVDDHRALRHRHHRARRDQLRRRLARDQRGRDDDVRLLGVLARSAPARRRDTPRSSPWRSRRRPRPPR